MLLDANIILEMKNISKSFGGIPVLSGVNLTLKKGHVHTILGENGAGKSTLMKILAGVYQPDEGEIYINGERVTFKNPLDSQKKGISVIYQELSLCPNLSVAANIFANREQIKNKFFLDEPAMFKKAEAILNELDSRINANESVRNLTISQQQLVEIAKALSQNSNILIMDEPTSALSEAETERLFNIIRKLKEKGVSILYISHRMDEIFKISDEITVLRDGKYIGTVLAKDAKIDQLIKMMTGREFKDIYPPRVRNISNDVYFRIRNLSCKDYFEDVNLELKKGEILGIFGMVGAGRSEVAKTIFGIMKRNSGDIEIDDRMVEINCPHDAIKNGIAFVTEDRRKEGLVLINSVKVNITMVSLANIMSKLGFLNTEKENNIANNAVTKLRIKVTSIDQKVNKLSGGNQQKVVLAKWLEIRPKILILDEPTRGIDVGAKY